jgi:hypothetical protein
MSIPLQIGNTIVNFPSSGASPDWSGGLVAFAEAVTTQLSGLSLPSDILPTVQVLTSDANSGLALSGATFPNATVRSFNFNYAIYRTNGVTFIAETGEVVGIYNTGTSTWEIQRDYEGDKQSDGTSYHSFTMSGDNLTFSSTAIGGSYSSTNSKISFSAKTQLVSSAG